MKQNSKWTNTIIFAVILVFLNLVSISIFTRLDLSQGKVYSLSKSSKEIVKNLDDRILVQAYFSKNLPSQYADLRRYVEDMLDEYAAYGKGNFKFEFIDPTDEEKLKKEAQQNGIQPATMRVNENDQLVIREVYLGLAFHYHDKVESIPIVQNSQGLEYDITSKIKKITESNMQKVAFFALDDEEPDPRYPRPGKYDTVKLLIGESYELVTTTLEEELADDISVLVFAGVNEDLSEEQLQNLDKYIVQGGKIMFFQDRVDANLQQQSAKLLESNIFDLLSFYGIKIKENLVADAKCGQISIQRRQGIFSMNTPVNYPYLPLITNMNKEHPITKNIDMIQAVFISELDTLHTALKFEPLFYSSENSSTTSSPNFNIRIEQYMKRDLRMMLNDGKKVLGGIYSGNVKSKYDNKLESQDTEIIFIADSDFIMNGGGAGSDGNLNFFINSIDYLSGQKSLINLRSRETVYRPLKEVSNSQKDFIKYLNVILPVLLLILVGIIIHRKEIKRRKQIGEIYE